MSTINQGTYANYDALTGVGTAEAYYTTGNFGQDISTISLTVNRATQAAFGLPLVPNVIQQLSGTGFTDSIPLSGSFFTIGNDVASNDTGHIYVALNDGSAGFKIFTSISDPSPTNSAAWPGTSGQCGWLDTLGTDVYGIDGITGAGSGLYVMHGDGPAISLADASVTGPLRNTSAGSKPLLGDPVNNGLWLERGTDVQFWSPVGPTTTTIPITSSPGFTAGMCLDETASNLYVLYFPNGGSNYSIAVISTATKSIVNTISLATTASPAAMQQGIATFGGYCWVLAGGGNIYSDIALKAYVYRVKVSDSTITTLDKTADYSSAQSVPIVSNGRLIIPGYRYDCITRGDAGTFSANGLTLTDSTQAFFADGVSALGDVAFAFVVGNPGDPVSGVSGMQLALTFGDYQNITQMYWVFRPLPLASLDGDSDLTADAIVQNPHIPGNAQILTDSDFTADLHIKLGGMTTCAGNSIVTPTAKVHGFFIPTSIHANSAVTGNLTVAYRATVTGIRATGTGSGSISVVVFDSGTGTVSSNVLTDNLIDFIADGIVPGMFITIASGPNAGTYLVIAVLGPHQLQIAGVFPHPGPTPVGFTISGYVFSDPSQDFFLEGLLVGDFLVITSGPDAGRYGISFLLGRTRFLLSPLGSVPPLPPMPVIPATGLDFNITTSSLVADASVSEVLYHLIHGTASFGGNSNATGIATYPSRPSSEAVQLFTPVGVRRGGLPTADRPESAEVHYRIVPPTRR